MVVANDTVVTIAYTLKDADGSIIDASGDGDALSYLHGHQNIVPGLESALSGKAVGDEVNAEVAPEEGYGERREDLVFSVPRDRMPADTELEPGMQFRAQGEEGQEMVVTLVEVGENEVQMDGNHPLAGQTLFFDVAVQDIREATAEEISHGHVH
jgi:FKBP-type peptidyl-prolyl cis-trans isomerase SlyD